MIARRGGQLWLPRHLRKTEHPRYWNVRQDPSLGGGGGGASGVFFAPNIGALNNGNTLVSSGTFVDVNRADGGDANVQSAVTRPGGQTKCIAVTYTQDESQALLKPAAFTGTTTLYIRKYEMYSSNCEGHWPVGWKTSRIFTTNDFTGPDGNAYMSEKFIWQRYPVNGGNPNDLYWWGLNHACYNLDVEAQYPGGSNFGASQWLLLETFMRMNTAPDVTDGLLQCRVNKTTVLNQSIAFRSNSRGCPNGTHWQSMWFGGNVSFADFDFPTGQTLTRYIDSPYLSTTADWVS